MVLEAIYVVRHGVSKLPKYLFDILAIGTNFEIVTTWVLPFLAGMMI